MSFVVTKFRDTPASGRIIQLKPLVLSVRIMRGKGFIPAPMREIPAFAKARIIEAGARKGKSAKEAVADAQAVTVVNTVETPEGVSLDKILDTCEGTEKSVLLKSAEYDFTLDGEVLKVEARKRRGFNAEFEFKDLKGALERGRKAAERREAALAVPSK